MNYNRINVIGIDWDEVQAGAEDQILFAITQVCRKETDGFPPWEWWTSAPNLYRVFLGTGGEPEATHNLEQLHAILKHEYRIDQFPVVGWGLTFDMDNLEVITANLSTDLPWNAHRFDLEVLYCLFHGLDGAGLESVMGVEMEGIATKVGASATTLINLLHTGRS